MNLLKLTDYYSESHSEYVTIEKIVRFEPIKERGRVAGTRIYLTDCQTNVLESPDEIAEMLKERVNVTKVKGVQHVAR